MKIMKFFLIIQAAVLAVLINMSAFAELPKLTTTPLSGVTFPESVVDLNASFTLDGVSIEGGILPLLSQTVTALDMGNFSTFAQVNGIMRVTGTGTDEGVEFFFMPPLEENIEIVNTGGPDLNVVGDGSYVATATNGLQIRFYSAPKYPALLLEAIGGVAAGAWVRVNEDGLILMNIVAADGTNKLIAGAFEPNVIPSELSPGIHFEGIAGAEETATLVYSDSTQQKFHQTIVDRQALDAAVEPFSDQLSLSLEHHADGTAHFVLDGNPWYATPEMAVTLVSDKPNPPVINVLTANTVELMVGVILFDTMPLNL